MEALPVFYQELATQLSALIARKPGRVDLDFLTGVLLVSLGGGMPSGALIFPVGTCAAVANIRPTENL